MARMAWVVVPGYPHHVTQRGNRRQKIFFCEDDYQTYIELMTEFVQVADTEIRAYCLMPNHIHLVMVPDQEDGLRTVSGETHRRYTRHVNFREGWRGHLWQERFHSFPMNAMNANYLLSTVRYVEQNPVEAGLCVQPEGWKWSSAGAHMAGVDDALEKVQPMLDRIGNWGAYLSGNDNIAGAETQIEKHTRTGRPLGGQKFVSQLELLTGRSLVPRKSGPKPGNKGS